MFIKFVSWFIGGLILLMVVQIFFNNPFVTGFVGGALMGILAAKGD